MTKGTAAALLSSLVLAPLLLLGVGVLAEAGPLVWIGLAAAAILAVGGGATAVVFGRRLADQDERSADLEAALAEQRQNLQEQGEQLRLFAGAARSVKMGYFSWDLVSDRCVRCSEEYAALHGVSVAEYFEKAVDLENDASFVHPDDRDSYLKICAETLKNRQPLDIQYRIVAPDGRVRFVRELEFSFTTRDGVPLRSEGMIQDITDLRRSETLLLAAMNAGAAVYAIFDPEDRLLLANPGYISLFGERSVEIKTGMHYETIVRNTAAAGSIQGSKAEIEAWVQARLARREHPAKGMRFQSKDRRWFEIDDVILGDGHVFTLGTDITDRTAMEARLQNAQRTEAVGQVAAGMAHDFNNLLEIIHGNAELLSDRAGEEAAMLEAIQQAAHKAGELTQSLLTFSSRQELRPQSLALAPLIRDLVRQFRRNLASGVVVETDIATNLPSVRADHSQLETAIINLMENAAHAMPGGGSLKITCQRFDPASDEIDDLPDDRHYVSLVFTDSGVGMAPEVVEQAFEPFFSTDQGARRSGLGLSMVYGFAQQSGGYIDLVSQPGKGTEARLILPVAERRDRGSTGARRTTISEIQPGQGEMVLLLDDDKAVRAVLKAHLKRLGYRTAEAESANEASSLLASENIDIALVDIMLAEDCSGPEFVASARESRPDLPVIYISGYSAERAALDPRTPLLTKPFTRHQLAHTLRAVLSSAPERETVC